MYVWLFLVHLRFKEAIAGRRSTLSWGGVASMPTVTSAAGGPGWPALLPAWWATRVRPLEAMVPAATAPSRRAPWLAAVAGLVLVCVDPAIVFIPWDSLVARWSNNPVQMVEAVRLFSHFGVGVPSFMLGFFLLGPAFVILLEKVASPIVSAVLGLRPALLRQQLSNGVWRAAGTGAALMVGLAILISMETEGNSVLQSWQLPDRFPDMFIVSWATALTDHDVAELNKVPGIKPGWVMPIAVASPEYGGSNLMALTMAALVPDAAMFLGVEPGLAMKMMKLDFRQGNETDAIRLMDEGDHVLITDELHQSKHLNLGDNLPMKTSHGTVNFRIAGVVSAPGMDLINGQFDMARQFDQRTAGSIFGSRADAVKYFDAADIHLLAADLDTDVEKEKVMKGVVQRLGEKGLVAGDIRAIKQKMTTAFHNVLLVITAVPLGAMLVASLGVTNTIMASVRTRRWQLGVLRSVGLTRSQLLRLILGESMLIGVVGCGMGLAAGALMTLDGHELSRIVTGMYPAVKIPWGILAGGVLVVMGTASAAGLWPAVTVARTEPIKLLQAGRATA